MADSIIDVGTGAVNTVYVITYHNLLARWLSTNNVETVIGAPTSLMKVDVDARGDPWVINTHGTIFQYISEVDIWYQIPYWKAKDIACGVNTGQVWIINTYG